MGTPLRLLIVEDSDDDARLLVREVRHGGFDPKWERVDSATALGEALDREPWDIVISDFTIPGFSGIEALSLLRARDSDLPFIFVSGTIGEDVAVGAMKSGAHDYIMKGNLRRLVPAIERELREAALRREHRRMAALVQQLANYDVLTNLPNRASLRERLQEELRRAQREDKPFAFVIMDLDGFKEINNTLGHRVGDVLLQQVGRRIERSLTERDTVARLGGDEFAILLPGTDERSIEVVTRRILQAVEEPFHAEGLELRVRASIGISLCPRHGTTPDLLMQRADVAMYVAKENKSGFAIYSQGIDRHNQQRLTIRSELSHAIQDDRLVLHYQPKVALADRRVLGLEVLSRWPHPTEGLLPPGRFINVAEQAGLIGDLTLAAIDVALRVHRCWCAEEWKPVVAVNVSPHTLRDARFPDVVAALVLASGAPPGCLELEITENVIMTDPAQALATLTRLGGMGIRLSIDDFGTGYSSLSYLKKLPVDEIKIDRSFITDLARHGDETIVRSTIDLAHNLGLTVVAEGVENRATWDRLAALGCDAVQGFYISPPVPFDEVTTWLANWRDSTGVPQCSECHRRGTARHETTVQGKTVTGVWRCTACQAVWSASRTE
jgi:diguanylate cyclase (GGDEF)-like protein